MGLKSIIYNLFVYTRLHHWPPLSGHAVTPSSLEGQMWFGLGIKIWGWRKYMFIYTRLQHWPRLSGHAVIPSRLDGLIVFRMWRAYYLKLPFLLDFYFYFFILILFVVINILHILIFTRCHSIVYFINFFYFICQFYKCKSFLLKFVYKFTLIFVFYLNLYKLIILQI